MRFLILLLLLMGGLLLGFGLRASNDHSQSADVRVGGAIPMLVGIGFIGLAFIIGFFWLLLGA